MISDVFVVLVKQTGRTKVSFALLLFLINLVAHLGALTYYTFSIRSDVWPWLSGMTGMEAMESYWYVKAGLLSIIFLPLGATLGPLIFYIGIGLMKDIEALRRQLSSFSIEHAKCYCCSISHHDPSSGLQVACDRELIFVTLQEWYGSKDGSNPCFVKTFNALVRDNLASIVQETLMDVSGQLRHGMQMVMVVLMPLLPCFLMPAWEELEGWSNGMLLVFFLRSLLNWAKLPLVAMLAFWVAIRNSNLGLYLCQRRGGEWSRWRQMTASCLMTILTIGILSVAWLPFEVVFLVTRDDQSFFPVIPFLALLLLDICIFVPAVRPFKWLSQWVDRTHCEEIPSI